MNSRRQLFETLELTGGGGVVAILSFAFVLCVARFLDPGEYADFSAAMSFFYFAAVAISPLAPATARLVAGYVAREEPERAAALHRALRRLILGGALLVAVGATVVAAPLARAFHFQSPWTVALAVVSTAIFTFVSFERGVLQGLGRYRAQNLNAILEAAVRLLAAVVLLRLLPEPASALAAHAGALLLAGVLLSSRPGDDGGIQAEMAGLKRLAGPLFVAMIGIAVFSNADVLVAKRFFPADLAGNYGAASWLARSVSILFVPIYTVAGPMLTTLHLRGEPLTAPTLRLCGLFVALSALPVAFFFLAGDRVITLFYGAAFHAAGPMLMRVAGIAVITYLSLIIGQALITMGNRRFAPIYSGFAVVQVAALLFARQSVGAIIMTQYCVQLVLLILLFIVLIRSEHSRRSHSSS